MIWGQSAGAAAVDYYSFRYWDDPITHAIFAQSGNAYNGASLDDPEHTNFTFVAKNVGCDFPNDYEAELECMQKVDANKIVAFMGHYQDRGSSAGSNYSSISFSVVADGRSAFGNNTGRLRVPLRKDLMLTRD
jgi:acetylcholinesterase